MRWGNQREVDMWPCHSQVTVRTQIVRLFRERKPLIVFNEGVSDRESSSISRSIKKNVKLGNTNPFSVFFLLAYFLSFKNLCMTCMWDVLYMCVCSYVWPLQCVWVLLYMCVFMCVSSITHGCQYHVEAWEQPEELIPTLFEAESPVVSCLLGYASWPTSFWVLLCPYLLSFHTSGRLQTSTTVPDWYVFWGFKLRSSWFLSTFLP